MYESAMRRSWWLMTPLAVALCTGGAWAQASFSESFDDNGAVSTGQYGPANLIAKGWTFRMQSSPASSEAFSDGNHGSGWPTPQAGPGYLAADAVMSGPGPVSHWAILPTVPNQVAGDRVTLHVRRLGSIPARVEVRYSPSGGTSTGSGPTAVGDFTQLLGSIDPVPTGGWLAYSAAVPGAGRIALRFAGQYQSFSGGMYSGIDTLSVGTPPPPPCNLPPSPAPGQSVVWTRAGSPYRICTDLLIPAGSSVTVEPGVTINVDEGKSLVIDGRVTAHGTPSLPITWNGGISTVHPPVSVPNGTLDLAFGVVTGRILGGAGTSLLIADTTFSGQGTLGTAGTTLQNDGRYAYAQVDRCTFGPGGISVTDGTLAVRDSTFDGGSISVLRGALWTTNVSLDGGIIDWNREWPGQSALIDSVSILNNPSLPALRLEGGNYLLGPDNILQKNLYPVEIKAGLLPGTDLPLAGNTNNYIRSVLDSETPRGKLVWSDLELPYVVEGNAVNGTASSLRIDPGTVVRFKPDAQWSFLAGQRLLAEGLPNAPITFEAFTPGQPWTGISFNSNHNMPRLEDCIVRGSRVGIVASDTPNVWLQDCLIEGNGTGANATVFGWLRVRKTRFFNNGVGIFTDSYPVSHGTADLYGGTNPNWFQGNGFALQITNSGSTIPAQLNYWGHPTGPRHPQNPAGQGDPISTGGSTVDIFPFRTSPPDFKDHPPVVRMKEPYSLQRTGEKLILEWAASDDGGIVAQKVLFTPHGNNPDFSVIAQLSPSQRRYELTIPVIPPSSNITSPFVRILAVDTAGQEGFDEVSFGVPYTEDWTGTLTVTSDYSGELRPGERADVCWTKGNGASGTIDASLFLDGDDAIIPLGGAHTGVSCLSIGMVVPYVSTDSARIGLRLNGGAGGRSEWFFSDFFSIRPDPRVGDLPPGIEVISPAPGSSYPGGTAVPIQWSATDDQGVRSISIQASYDGGRTWNFIARDLPGGTTSYNWNLPNSAGIPNVRLRVIAADLRFQSSSDTVPISILPGSGLACYADCDGDQNLDSNDLTCFDTLFARGDPAADCNQDGGLDGADPSCFKEAFERGCFTKPKPRG
jgi:hypothetical protein